MQLWIGTSGYVFSDWVGSFYPPGLSSKGMLTYYARRFPLVELNYTFYRLPEPPELVRLAERAPAGFQFIVKLHQSLTHLTDLSGAVQFRQAVDGLKQQNRLLGLLCQYPQRVHHSKENVDRLEALADQFAGHELAVEFRHSSWHRPDVIEWLRERHLNIVSVDVPDIPNLFPRGLFQSGRTIYVRFHSRRGDRWYESDQLRYDYLFSDAELGEWLQALADRQDAADRALLLFNNCHRGQAAANAQRVQQLLAQLGLSFQVVQPFAFPPDESEQKALF